MATRFQKIKESLATKTTWDDIFIRNQSLGDTDEGIINKSYSKSDLVYICISTTAKAISQVPLVLGKRNKDNEWEPLEEENPWKDKLKRPNYLLDRYSFFEAIVSYLLLDGEVWTIAYPPNDLYPEAIWVVSKNNMSPIRNQNTGQLDGWNYRPSQGNSIELSIDEACHIFFWNPYDPLRGFAPLEAGKIPIVTDYKAAKYNQVFFENFASMGGVLTTEQKLNKPQVEELKAEIERKYSGYKLAHKMLILYGGLQYQATVPSHKDMMFKDLQSMTRERILQIFGMKKSIISVTEDINYATSENEKKNWWQDTNLPIMRLVASAFNFSYFEDYFLEARFDTSGIEALQEDFNKKVETGKKLSDIGFSANEINERLELGFESKPIRDVIWRPATAIPYSVEGDPTKIEEEVIPLIEEEEPEEEIFLPNKIKGNLIEYKSFNFNEYGEKIWKSLINVGGNIERQFRSKVYKAFFDYRVIVLDWLYRQNSPKSRKGPNDPFVLTSPLIEIEELSVKPFTALKAEADALYESSLISGIETISVYSPEIIPVDILVLPESQAFLNEKAIRLVGEDGIQRTISKQLNRSLSEGLANGETVNQMSERVKGVFGAARSRVKTIARTETYGALNHGRWVAENQSPFKIFNWFTALDEKVRRKMYDHFAMHGAERKKGEMWIVGGDSIRYPADYLGSPGNVINCRCIEVPDLTSI